MGGRVLPLVCALALGWWRSELAAAMRTKRGGCAGEEEEEGKGWVKVRLQLGGRMVNLCG
jgi:hypothetical protein